MSEKYKKLNNLFINLSTKNTLLILIFSVCMFTYIIICKATAISIDFYWMINLGNYVKENHTLPATNVWLIHDNFKTIYQSWLGSLAVYGWYELFQENMSALVILGYIYITIHTIVSYKYCRLFTENKLLALTTSSICTLAAWSMLNARPSLITSAVFYIELTLLTRHYIKKDLSLKKLIIGLLLISVILANWQASLWPFIIILELPFIAQTLIYLLGIIKTPTDKKEYITQLKHQLISIPLIIITGLINPYGYKAEIYSWISREGSAWSRKVTEYSPENNTIGVISFESIIVLLIIIVLINCIRKKKVQPYEIFLTLGTLFVAILQKRQSYMLMYGAVSINMSLMSVYENKLEELNKKSNIILKYISIFIITVMVSLLFITRVNDTVATEPVIEYLDSEVEENNLNKSDLKIMTDLRAAYLQFNGYKTYEDTRNETLSHYISGQTPRKLPDGSELDVLNEFAILGYYLYDSDLDNLLEYYDSNYKVDSAQNFSLWLQHNPEYEALYEDFFNYYDFDYAVLLDSCFKLYMDCHPEEWQSTVIKVVNSDKTMTVYKRIRN